MCAAALAPPAARGAVASHFTLALGTPVRLAVLRAAARRSAYIVLQPWEAKIALALKREDPTIKVLVYQDLGSMSASVGADGLSSSGVAYAAAAAHRDWFLTTPAGARIRENGYRYLYMADIGNRGYQRRWTADVLALLRRGPWDGVFMDDVNASPHPEAGTAKITEYPNDAAYETAVGSMLAYAGSRIRASGKLVIANFGEWVDHPALIREWLRDVDGGMDERFVRWSAPPGEGYRPPQQWLVQEREVLAAEAMGKRFLAVTAASAHDARAALYGWASLLLVADGTASVSYLAAGAYDGAAPWLRAYRTRLGHPLGRMRPGPAGIYRRSFADGLVVVNPTGHGVRVRFGGRFSGSGLMRARAATLGPERALVLVGVRPRTPDLWWWPVVAGALLLGLLGAIVLRWRARGLALTDSATPRSGRRAG